MSGKGNTSGKPCFFFLCFFHFPQVQKATVSESSAYLKQELPSTFSVTFYPYFTFSVTFYLYFTFSVTFYPYFTFFFLLLVCGVTGILEPATFDKHSTCWQHRFPLLSKHAAFRTYFSE